MALRQSQSLKERCQLIKAHLSSGEIAGEAFSVSGNNLYKRFVLSDLVAHAA